MPPMSIVLGYSFPFLLAHTAVLEDKNRRYAHRALDSEVMKSRRGINR
jgi:hypothetical protein